MSNKSFMHIRICKTNMGNQKPYIEEQTIQCPKENWQKDKQ